MDGLLRASAQLVADKILGPVNVDKTKGLLIKILVRGVP